MINGAFWTRTRFTLLEDETGAAHAEEILRARSVILIVDECARSRRWNKSTTLQKRNTAAHSSSTPHYASGQTEEATLLTAACSKAAHRLLSVEASIVACALQANTILLPQDPAFKALSEQVRLEALPDQKV